ncbi:MAG TPA: invasion associated locus B family protein [Bradyrhizobium sp.]|jgi:invasion protein IalB|nr:invasion associated locus B family protein [Bradyrhizobium sp.]
MLAMLFLTDFASGVAYAQQKPDGAFANEKPSGQEVASRGQRAARVIKYSDWRKFCFERSGTAMVCRTSISGTFETGQSAVRIDLIEREGYKPARLQLFLPVGLYLQAGATIAIDGGAAWRIPYVWCLASTCVAAADAEPKLIEEMRAGKTLVLEVVDSSVLAVTTAVPVNGFAAARQGAPARTFEQAIDE